MGPKKSSVSTEDMKTMFTDMAKDPEVINCLKSSISIDYEKIADIVTSKLVTRIEKLENELLQKDAEIRSLEKTVATLDVRCDQLEQYSRRISVRISGIPEKNQEDPEHEVNAVFTAMGISPTIQRCHRVGPKSTEGKPRPLLVQFTGYRDKNLVISKRNSLRRTMPQVFVNEDLTRKRAKLLFLARKMITDKKLLGAWSSDGRILVKNNQNKIVAISSEQELSQI